MLQVIIIYLIAKNSLVTGAFSRGRVGKLFNLRAYNAWIDPFLHFPYKMCLFFPIRAHRKHPSKILCTPRFLETRPNIHGFYNTILICDCDGFEFLIHSGVLFRESGFCFCCCFCCWGKLLLSRFSAPYPKMQNVCTKHFWAGFANIFLLVLCFCFC